MAGPDIKNCFSFITLYSFTYLCYMCVGECTQYLCAGQRTTYRTGFSCYCVGPRGQTQFVKFGGRTPLTTEPSHWPFCFKDDLARKANSP